MVVRSDTVVRSVVVRSVVLVVVVASKPPEMVASQLLQQGSMMRYVPSSSCYLLVDPAAPPGLASAVGLLAVAPVLSFPVLSVALLFFLPSLMPCVPVSLAFLQQAYLICLVCRFLPILHFDKKLASAMLRISFGCDAFGRDALTGVLTSGLAAGTSNNLRCTPFGSSPPSWP